MGGSKRARAAVLGLAVAAGCSQREEPKASVGGPQTGLADSPPVVGGANPTGIAPERVEAPGGR